MRKLLTLGVVLAALTIPTASNAQFSLGLRLGFAPAMGDASKGNPMTDGVKSQIPLQVDAMFGLSPAVAVGGYLSYGFGQLNSDLSDSCDAVGVDCSISDLRIGAQATYSFIAPSRQFVPWLGAGIGLEWLTEKVSAGGVSASADAFGIEFLNLQAGGDYKVSEQFAIGPYAMVSIGRYSSVEGNDIPEKAVHEWLYFGVRGRFDF